MLTSIQFAIYDQRCAAYFGAASIVKDATAHRWRR